MAGQETRAEQSESTYTEARRMAVLHGMFLSECGEGQYQLKCLRNGWIVNLYPRRKGARPRAYHDRHHKGPFIALGDKQDSWTLLDFVEAACSQWRNSK